MLWQLWLIYGPSYRTMRDVLSSVRWVLTDFGTESSLHEAEDSLCAFYRYLKGEEVPPIQRGLAFLLPNAMLQPGWHHLWDNILKLVVNSLDWAPGWIAGMKAVIQFVQPVA